MTGLLLTTEILKERTAASKARADVLSILEKSGYSTFALPNLLDFTNFRKLWKILSGMKGKDQHILIEYPFRARFRLYFVFLMTRLRDIKLYGIVHDIGSLRKQTRAARDMIVVCLFDGLVSHNASMTSWLRQKGYNKKIVNLECFDYLLKTSENFAAPDLSDQLTIIYAGHLGYNKAPYIYDTRFGNYKGVEINLYGEYFEKERINGRSIVYKGIFNPDRPDLKENYHFGLIWEGTGTDTCRGVIGEYLRYNNPHKFSFYMALGLPVIVWKEAAIARFVTEHQVGLVINNLDDLSKLQERLDPQTYRNYIHNVASVAQKVRNGYFLKTALQKLIDL